MCYVPFVRLTGRSVLVLILFAQPTIRLILRFLLNERCMKVRLSYQTLLGGLTGAVGARKKAG